jgi:hypothetical protein
MLKIATLLSKEIHIQSEDIPILRNLIINGTIPGKIGFKDFQPSIGKQGSIISAVENEANAIKYSANKSMQAMVHIYNQNPILKQKKTTEKWMWKMDFCKKNQLAPAQKWAWDKAENAFRIEQGKNPIATGMNALREAAKPKNKVSLAHA